MAQQKVSGREEKKKVKKEEFKKEKRNERHLRTTRVEVRQLPLMLAHASRRTLATRQQKSRTFKCRQSEEFGYRACTKTPRERREREEE